MKLNIKGPIKTWPSKNYLLVIEDVDNTRHYFLPNGDYDGYDKECKK